MGGTTNVVFGVHNNFPRGKNSIIFESIGGAISNRRVRLFAEDRKKPGRYYTLDSLSNKKLTLRQVSRILKDGFDNGEFLTGDVFYAEVFDKGGRVKGIKLNASEFAPDSTTRSSSAIDEYTFSL